MDKTIPGPVSGSMSPENLGRVISNKASAICTYKNAKNKKTSTSEIKAKRKPLLAQQSKNLDQQAKNN